jgi:hypothetical protein
MGISLLFGIKTIHEQFQGRHNGVQLPQQIQNLQNSTFLFYYHSHSDVHAHYAELS